MGEYKNIGKFGVYVKDVDKVVEPNDTFNASMSGNIHTLIKQGKIVEVNGSEETVPKTKGKKKKEEEVVVEDKQPMHISDDDDVPQDD